MSSINHTHTEGEDFLTTHIETDTQTAKVTGEIPYRNINLYMGSKQIINDGADAATVTIEVVDGLEVANRTDPANATVLDYDGEVAVFIDGVETTKILTGGSVSFDVTTQKSAGSTIEIVAGGLSDHPSEGDTETIEVVS